MIAHPLLAGTVFLLLAQPVADTPPAGTGRVVYGRMFFHQRVIIRVPRMPERAYPKAPVAPPVVEWRERKAERCIPVVRIAGATLTTPESVDLLIEDGTRLRAHFDDDCPSLDFYAGVYIRANSDGQLCAKRDVVRARSGRQCPIRSFKWVEPKHREDGNRHHRRRLP